ncbi:hypothetical protein EDD86DRAFT_197732 [Gorgonomyces haynaldii]|nr:hypothetical protein EDD86DRAFT_197732 [Gorgonomyces haynaldii]
MLFLFCFAHTALGAINTVFPLSKPPSFPKTQEIRLKIAHHAVFGDEVRVVGSFNDWNPKTSIPCHWCEGDIWICQIPFSAGQTIEWKAIQFGNGTNTLIESPIWEPGENNRFVVGIQREYTISY